MNDTTINEKQANSWAQETTLKSLVAQSSNGNKLLGLIAKAVDKDNNNKDLIDSLSKLVTATQTATGTAQKTLTEEDKLAKATQELKTAFGESSSSFKSLLSTDANNIFGGVGYAFKDLSGSLKVTNPALSKLAGQAAIVAEVFQVIWTRGTEMANAVFDMYDAGLVFSGGISQLADDAAATGLDLQTLSKVLTKHGQVVASMGIARTAQLGKAFNLATQGGTALGMTFEQAQDTLLSYTDQLRSTGQLRNTSDEEIIAGAKEYGTQLNRLSQITGQRREQIDQEIKQNLKRPDVNVLLSTLNESMRESTKKGLSELQVLGPEMAGTFQDMIIAAKTGGLPAMLATNENMTQMLQQSGQMNNFMGLVDATTQGNKDAMDNFIEQIGAGSQAFARDRALFTKMGGPLADQVNLASGIAVQSRSISERNAALLKEMPIPADAARIKEAQQDITSSFNALNQALSSLASSLLAPLAKPFAMLIGGLTGIVTVAVKVADAFTVLLYPLDVIGDVFSWLADKGKMLLGSFGLGGGAGSVGGAALDIGALAGTIGTVLLGGGVLKKILTSPTVLSFFTGPMMTRIMGTAGNLLKRIPGMGMFSRIGGLGAGGTGGIGNLGAGKLVESLKSFGTAISGTITTVAETIGKVSGSLMQTIAAIGKGLGGAVGGLLGGILEGLSVGLKAMADPMILLGAGILGGSIALIGAGIAGATWIMGAAMPKLAEGLQAFTDVDGEKLKSTGMGMLAIAGGLAAMGAAEIVKGLGGLVSGLTSWFTEDPIAKFKRFGEIAEPLQKSADAMSAFSIAYPNFIETINSNMMDPQALANIDKLKDALSNSSVFSVFGGGQTASSPGIFGSLFGSSTPDAAAPAAAPAAATAQTTAVRTAPATPDQRHQQMMDMLSKLNDNMASLVTMEDRQIRVLSDGFSGISGVVH